MAIIILAHLDPRLHTPMYFFLTHLSLMDLCYTTGTVPQLLFNLQGPEKTISYGGCVGQLYVSLAMGSTECILLAVMAVDRYVAVCWPLHYTVLMHPHLCWQLAATTWLTGLVSSLVQTVLTTQVPLCGRNIIDHVFCALLLLVPLTLILISYSCIAQAVWKIESAEGRQKALGTCSSHLVVVFLFYSTAMATYLQPTADSFQNQDKFMALLYGIVTPTLNPFIYTLGNKDVKGALMKMIGKDFLKRV
ncbi:unnamed protein product [Gulo gulo]|uniref:G-protein coupled receptors family 1 profile domain-containing protein n=1 Tax=Gulo gulo TaxID=48420 RepID=A0A9X9MCV7_GULGU|nr:unnamed protein product [Gulo gulo]